MFDSLHENENSTVVYFTASINKRFLEEHLIEPDLHADLN